MIYIVSKSTETKSLEVFPLMTKAIDSCTEKGSYRDAETTTAVLSMSVNDNTACTASLQQ